MLRPIVRKRRNAVAATTLCKQVFCLTGDSRLYMEHENLKNRLTNVKPVLNTAHGSQYDGLAQQLSKRRQNSHHMQ